jgi:hypothetical protein
MSLNEVAKVRDEWCAEFVKQRDRAERLRLELEKIAWMDEFLEHDDCAGWMLKIARDAIIDDEERE